MAWIKKVYNKIDTYGHLVMFSHTIFSFSFAFVCLLIATNGVFSELKLFYILLALIFARTGANSINRVIDAEIDKKNARTSNRHIPIGEVKKKEVIFFSLICFFILVYASSKINFICFILSPVALFFMITYSYTKRFTFLCHLYLGFTCAMAPMGVYLAIKGGFYDIYPFLLFMANMFWVAGFDIIYGSQDYDFDCENGIHSMAVKFGVLNALKIALFFHIITFILLCSLIYFVSYFGLIYAIGLVIIGGLLVYEHKSISPNNLTNVNIASYSVNQLIAVVFIVFSTVDFFM